MSEEEIVSALIRFIREEFLWGDEGRELDETSPLLEWGIIDSLRTALLLAHIRDEFGVHVSAAKVDAQNFRDVRNIAGLVMAGMTRKEMA